MKQAQLALLARAAAGERDAEQTLLEQNSGLIWSIARRFYGRGVDPDDLFQLGSVGFIKAVRGFDPTLGFAFSTYAVPKITGEIRRFLRDDGTVKVSRVLRERAAKLHRMQEEMEAKTGRCPTVHELAAASGLTPEEVAACEGTMVQVDSLERETQGGGTLSDLVGDSGMEERTVLYLSLRDALETLPDKERHVLHLRYDKCLTQAQTARLMGVSQVQVSRLEKRAVEALKTKLSEQ